MSNLSIQTFGNFQVTLAGKPITDFRTRKVQALLVYLAAEPVPHSRDRLLELLWPGLPERSARSNLRQILYYLRQDIPDEIGQSKAPLTIANRQDIQLNPEAMVTIDTSRFETLLDEARNHDHLDLYICSDCHQNLEQAVELYQGDFLTDFFLDDSNVFEEWAHSRREYFRRRALDALSILTTIHTRRKEYPQAQKLAERQLEIDNISEGAYRQLMEILALNGRREQALAIYENCRRILAEELGMAPTARTTELYGKIVAGDLNFNASGQQDVRGCELKELIAEGGHGAIHRAIQPAIGREVAVKVIRRQYADDPDFIRRFEAEAQIVARLEHPHIVPLYDYWRDPNGAYLVMRYMRHGSLLNALQTGPWDPPQTANLLTQIAAALATAHQKGVIHRDIKPGNILLDETGNAYLTDFGIAKDLLSQEQITSENAVVGTLDYTSPEQILSGEVTPQSDIYSLGAVIYETLTGEKPFPDDSIANLLHNQLNNPMPLVSATRPDIPAEIDAVLQKATAKKAAERYATPQEMAAAFSQAIGELVIEKQVEKVDRLVPQVTEIYNPYKGLRAFQQADADDFFGRDNLVQQLVDRLGQSKSRFLAIVGPSGSGKSSAVKAGLIPALRNGALPGSENWFTTEMVPGSDPLEELELALWPVAVDPPPSLVEPMERDTRGLLRTLRRILPGEDGSQPQLLLIIDQFEELFTLVEDEERRAFFLDSLLAAIQVPRSPLRVVVTLRADFYDRPLLHQEWGQIIKDNTEIVLPLNHSELTWAVREPARRMGVRLNEELVATIVGDVADQLGALPLLQYALTELFEHREGNLITRKTYESIGGVQGALGRRAEAIYESLDENGREATRQLFLRLVTLGEGIEDTRRRVLRTEVENLALHNSLFTSAATAIHYSLLETVINSFGAARLLTFDRDPTTRTPTVEVAHEALLREWHRLRHWLEQSRDDVRLQRLLAQAAAEWVSADKDDAYLLRGSRLDQFGSWSEETQLALTQDEKRYLAASLAARTTRKEAEEARRQRELEAAHQLAESEKARADEQTRATTRLRWLAAGLAIIFLVAVVAALVAVDRSQKAQASANAEATSAAVANNEAVVAATSQAKAEQALATAAAAGEAEAAAAATAQAESVFRATAEADAIEQRDIAQEERETAVQQANIAQSRELALAALNTLDIDPELSILLAMEAVSLTNTVEAANSLHQAVIASRVRMRLPIGGFVRDVAYSPEGTYIAAITDDLNIVKVWEAESGHEIFETPIVHSWPPNAEIKISETQIAIVNIGETITLNIWDFLLSQEHSSVAITAPTENLFDYDLSPDWQEIAISYTDGSAGIWDAITGQPLKELPGHSDYTLVAYSANGQRLATVSSDNTAQIWVTDSWDILATINIGIGTLNTDRSGQFLSPDGNLLAISTGGGGNFIHIWNLADPSLSFDTPPMTSIIQNNFAFGIAFSTDGKKIAAGDRSQSAHIWDPFSGEELVSLKHGVNVWSTTFNPNGTRLLTGDWNGDVRIWDITAEGEAEIKTLKIYDDGRDFWTRRLTISHNGTRFVTFQDNKATIWELATGQPLLTLAIEDGFLISDADFNWNDTLILTSGHDGTAIIWDAISGERLMTLSGHQEGAAAIFTGNIVMAAKFSPDGTRVVTAGADKTARVWDVATGEQLFVLNGYESGLINVTYSPDGKLIATSGEESLENVKIWDAETGNELFSLPEAANHLDRVWGLEFSPDGSLLATSGGDTLARIWRLDLDARKAHLLATLTGHTGTVSNLKFNPDGQYLATTGGPDFKVWDLSNLYEINLEDISGPISIPEILSLPYSGGLAFHPDTGHLLVRRTDGTVRVFTLSINELLEIAANRVTRSLTDAECQQYLHLDACPQN